MDSWKYPNEVDKQNDETLTNMKVILVTKKQLGDKDVTHGVRAF